MAYTKTVWTNNVTALNATNMNHIEDGIESASNGIGELTELTTTVKSSVVAAVNEINSGKVDKVSTTNELAAYVHNGDTQGVKVVSNTPGSGQIPMYDSSNRIKTANPSANTDCANKQYVDGATLAYTENEIAQLFGIS